MDRIAHYKTLVRQCFEEIRAEIPDEEGIRTETIFDEANGHYEITQTGWEGSRRVHGSLSHCDVIGEKIYVEHDGTDFGIVDFLLERGVPVEHIVIGFHHPSQRHYTEFAVA